MPEGQLTMRNRQKILYWLSERRDKEFWNILYRSYEVVSYLFFGVLTTFVNFAVFTVLENLIGQENWYLSNLPAILLAILFAFFTNRSFVFDSDGGIWSEMYMFFGVRIVISFVFEYMTAFLLYNVLGFDSVLNLILFSVSWFKVISLITVFAANYMASKFIVFRTRGVLKDK